MNVQAVILDLDGTVVDSSGEIHVAINRAFAEEGLGADVVSGGELEILRASGFPMDRVYFHGNNKSREELARALDVGLGQVVVDNFHELDLLEQVCGGLGDRASLHLVEEADHGFRRPKRLGTEEEVRRELAQVIARWARALA